MSEHVGGIGGGGGGVGGADGGWHVPSQSTMDSTYKKAAVGGDGLGGGGGDGGGGGGGGNVSGPNATTSP